MILEAATVLAMMQAPVVCGAPSPTTPNFTVTSGSPYTVEWIMDATVPASATDPTLVPHRIDGFYLQIDAGTKADIKPTPGAPCPVGSVQAGKIPYIYRTTSGVARGSHTLTLSAYNFALGADGTPTTTRQEGPAVSVPFVGVDPVRVGPPTAPLGVIIKR